MDKIRVLPGHIIDAIAAGEVIERPYSIVKELLENSIDAGSKNIDIYVDNAGENSIIIIDDGRGIEEKQLKLCIQRHATSKITDNDISKVKTLGFRGEALYAIAAVSRLEITSKTSTMSYAVKLIVQENKVLEQKPSSGKKGTHILVENLFKNFPVRKKFLSTKKSEIYYIRETIKSIALSNPKINSAPRPNPTAAGITFTNPSPGLISIPGASKLQKLAATMTPPVKPSIPSKKARFIVLNKNTNDAPNAVIPQVNNVAYKAPKTGGVCSKKEKIS